MNMNDFFSVAEEFFTQLNPNFCEDYDYANSELEFWKLFDIFL